MHSMPTRDNRIQSIPVYVRNITNSTKSDYTNSKSYHSFNQDVVNPVVIFAGMGSRQFCRGRGQGREVEAEARQTKFEARPRRGDP